MFQNCDRSFKRVKNINFETWVIDSHDRLKKDHLGHFFGVVGALLGYNYRAVQVLGGKFAKHQISLL